MAGSNTPIFLGLKDIEEGIEGIEEEKSSLMLVKNFEKRFGQPPMFVASTHLDNVPQSANPGSLLKEIVHVISCSYKKLEWGKEIWLDLWVSDRGYSHWFQDALLGLEINLLYASLDRLQAISTHQSVSPIGSVEICLSWHFPLWYGYGGGLKCLERFPYLNITVYPLMSLPLVAYCTLPAVCLLTEFIIPTVFWRCGGRIGEMDGGEMSSFGLLEMFLLTFLQCFKVY